MSLKDLIAGLLGRGNPMLASEALIHHVEGRAPALKSMT